MEALWSSFGRWVLRSCSSGKGEIVSQQRPGLLQAMLRGFYLPQSQCLPYRLPWSRSECTDSDGTSEDRLCELCLAQVWAGHGLHACFLHGQRGRPAASAAAEISVCNVVPLGVPLAPGPMVAPWKGLSASTLSWGQEQYLQGCGSTNLVCAFPASCVLPSSEL